MESDDVATAVKKPKVAKKSRPPREKIDPKSDGSDGEIEGGSNPLPSDSTPLAGDRKRRDSEPMMEEDIIDGFAIATFVNQEDLEVSPFDAFGRSFWIDFPSLLIHQVTRMKRLDYCRTQSIV